MSTERDRQIERDHALLMATCDEHGRVVWRGVSLFPTQADVDAIIAATHPRAATVPDCTCLGHAGDDACPMHGTRAAVPSYLREKVWRFAHAMEAKLRENDHKGGWEDCETSYLRDRLAEEVRELDAAVGPARLGEAADVANFSMMIADVYGYLPQVGPPPPSDTAAVVAGVIARMRATAEVYAVNCEDHREPEALRRLADAIEAAHPDAAKVIAEAEERGCRWARDAVRAGVDWPTRGCDACAGEGSVETPLGPDECDACDGMGHVDLDPAEVVRAARARAR